MNTRTALAWPKRPTTNNPHHDLGRRQRWTSRCGRYRVERFMESTRRYLALYAEPRTGYVWHIISDHRTLPAAQRACQTHARQLAQEQVTDGNHDQSHRPNHGDQRTPVPRREGTTVNLTRP